MKNFLTKNIFGDAGKTFSALFLTALFLLGLAHWLSSFRLGDIPMSIADWPKEKQYCLVLKQALEECRIPYFISQAVNKTDMFLGQPETMVSPQILLLKFLTPGQFMCVNIALFYFLGFLGLLLVRKKFKLTLLAFTALFLLLNFNGYIVSRMGVGHTQWFSVFLLPFFVLFTLELEAGKRTYAAALKIALLLFFILLQGGFHLYVWCLFFLAVLLLADLKKWKGPALAITASALLSAFRLLPAAVAFAGKSNTGSKGYPSVTSFFEALLVPRDCNYELYKGAFGWFEYNLFVDLTGFILLAWFGVFTGIMILLNKQKERSPALQAVPLKGIYLASLVTLFFTFDRFYGVFGFIPFFNSQSAALRMIIVPFTFISVFAAVRFDSFLRILKKGYTRALCAGGVLLLAGSLVENAGLWKIKRLEALMPPSGLIDLSLKIVDNTHTYYMEAVKTGYLISLLALLLALAALFFMRRHSRQK